MHAEAVALLVTGAVIVALIAAVLIRDIILTRRREHRSSVDRDAHADPPPTHPEEEEADMTEARKDAADALLDEIVADGTIPTPEREYRPWDGRRWRVDLAWPSCRVAVEVHGERGEVAGQRLVPDMIDWADRLTVLTLLGWRVLHFSTRDVEAGVALAVVRDTVSALSPLAIRSPTEHYRRPPRREDE